jgi:hypothetical protein
MSEMQRHMRLVDECPLREEGDEASQRAVEDSLWPSLCAKLTTLSSPRCDRFNGWIPAVTVAAVCLAMVLIASPPELSSQDGSAYSSGDAETWPTSLPSSHSGASTPLPAQPVGNAKRPRALPAPPLEMILGPGSVPATFPELKDPFDFRFDDSRSHGSGIYMGTK